MKKTLLIFLLLLLLSGAAFYFAVMWLPNTFNGDRVMVVSKGETFADVMNKLDKIGVIRSKLLFKIAGKLHGTTKKIQIGRYRFKSGMSNVDILEDLAKGISIEAIVFTIPEGLTTRRIASLLQRDVGIDSARFMELAHNEEFLGQLGIAEKSAEGYLFPKTYQLFWQDDESSILQQFIAEFFKEFTQEFIDRAETMNMSVHSILTLASIVEGETRIDSERAVVAGVYYNRLKKNIPLQADPTIQFILPKARPLKYSDLKRESPYNTYRYKGLPPGPVNNPGLASIKATLYPEKHNYLFFVATGVGGHQFTKNYKEHLKAVNQYKKVRQERLLQQQALEDSLNSVKTF